MNECMRNIDNCHDNANCTDTIGSYECTCVEGYEGDGFNCTSKLACCVALSVTCIKLCSIDNLCIVVTQKFCHYSPEAVVCT